MASRYHPELGPVSNLQVFHWQVVMTSGERLGPMAVAVQSKPLHERSARQQQS